MPLTPVSTKSSSWLLRRRAEILPFSPGSVRRQISSTFRRPNCTKLCFCIWLTVLPGTWEMGRVWRQEGPTSKSQVFDAICQSVCLSVLSTGRHTVFTPELLKTSTLPWPTPDPDSVKDAALAILTQTNAADLLLCNTRDGRSTRWVCLVLCKGHVCASTNLIPIGTKAPRKSRTTQTSGTQLCFTPVTAPLQAAVYTLPVPGPPWVRATVRAGR